MKSLLAVREKVEQLVLTCRTEMEFYLAGKQKEAADVPADAADLSSV